MFYIKIKGIIIAIFDIGKTFDTWNVIKCSVCHCRLQRKKKNLAALQENPLILGWVIGKNNKK